MAKNQNATVNTREEYYPFIWNKEKGDYQWLVHHKGFTLEQCLEKFKEYRKTWERIYPQFDFDRVEFRHRTVTTITSEWDKV